MNLIYRILGVIINTAAMLIFVSLILSLPVLLSQPLALFSAFLMASIVLYSWFSSKFQNRVLIKQEPVKHSLRDWVRVNGIVGIIFGIIILIDVAILLQNPGIYAEAIKNYGVEVPMEKLRVVFIVMLVYSICLLVHIFWTFRLMKKYKDYFQQT